MGVLLTSDVPAMIAALRDTRAIVFDVRNYPNGTLYLIAQWLNPAARNFVTFTAPDYRRPGTFEWTVDAAGWPVVAAAGSLPRTRTGTR